MEPIGWVTEYYTDNLFSRPRFAYPRIALVTSCLFTEAE